MKSWLSTLYFSSELKLVSWRLWAWISILPIFTDFLSMKHFEIPISFRSELLKLHLWFGNETFLWDFSNTVQHKKQISLIFAILGSMKMISVTTPLMYTYAVRGIFALAEAASSSMKLKSWETKEASNWIELLSFFFFPGFKTHDSLRDAYWLVS